MVMCIKCAVISLFLQGNPVAKLQGIAAIKKISRVLLFERVEHLSEYHNMRIDRMTMAHGVEAQVPFQDHRLVELSLHIPLPTLFGMSGKEWLQKVAKPWLPPKILTRQKFISRVYQINGFPELEQNGALKFYWTTTHILL